MQAKKHIPLWLVLNSASASQVKIQSETLYLPDAFAFRSGDPGSVLSMYGKDIFRPADLEQVSGM